MNVTYTDCEALTQKKMPVHCTFGSKKSGKYYQTASYEKWCFEMTEIEETANDNCRYKAKGIL